MQTTSLDRRRVARYTVRVPINVIKIGSGCTVNVSSTGIGFLIDDLLEPGLPIEFELAMAESDTLLHCDGHVVRVERRGPTNYTAATIDNIALKTAIEH